MSSWVSSDHHFHHANVIKHCNRPFSSVEEMNEALIENWNKVVADNHTIYHLGDFSFHRDFEVNRKLVKSLKGRKILIKGNHDKFKDSEYLRMGFLEVHNYLEIKHNKKKYILIHYPLLTWNGAHRGSIHCHGHSHCTVNYLNKGTTRIDVGVDNFNYTPVSIEEIEELMKDVVYTPVDHHGAEKKRP
jgi:calcineurin-like phosphoesterase family protein